MVSMAPGSEASPYQVLRVANWSAGMLNLAMKFVFYKALPTATYPSVLVPPSTSELYREPSDALQPTPAAVAVYSMAWITQLEVVSPLLSVPSLIVKAGGTSTEVATYVHLSLSVIVETTLITTPAASVETDKGVVVVKTPQWLPFCGQPTIASSILLFVP